MTTKKITKIGQHCKKCNTPVIKRNSKGRWKQNKEYYYRYYLFCPRCKTMYFIEEAKVYEVRKKKKQISTDNKTYDSYFKTNLGANVKTLCGKKGLIHRGQQYKGRYWVYPYSSPGFKVDVYDYEIISYF